MKLREYIEKQFAKSLFSGLLERYDLATEFICSFNDAYGQKDSAMGALVPFFSPDSLEITELPDQDGANFKRYVFTFPELGSINMNEAYSNFAYGDKRLFMTKPFIGKAHPSSNDEASNAAKSKPEYAVHTLACTLFYVYFGCHPLCGRAYYEKAAMTDELEREFFKDQHGFIFDIENNPNRFVNGYHGISWVIWNALTDEQRAFWREVFSTEGLDYATFYEKWKSAYLGFTHSSTVTPCGERLSTIVYSADYALVISDNTIGNKTVRCRNCNNALISRCEGCQVAPLNRSATFFTLTVKVQSGADLDGAVPETERELVLYDGKTLYGKDLGLDDSSAIFDVIASKKNSKILGLKYLQQTPMKAACGSITRFYEKDGMIALLPGTNVFVTPKTSRIIAPGEPVEVKPAPAPQPVPQPDPTPAPQPEPKKPEPTPAPQPETKKPDPTPAPQPEPKNPEPAPAPQPVYDESKTVYTEEGLEFDLLDDEPTDCAEYMLYKIRGRKKQQLYALKVFKPIVDMKKLERHQKSMDNVRYVISKKLSLPKTLIYPKAMADPTRGFTKGEIAYICNLLPDEVVSANDYVKSDIKARFEVGDVMLLLDFCTALKSLHDKGFAYKFMHLKNLMLDMNEYRTYLTDSDSVSDDTYRPPLYHVEFAAPERMILSLQPDDVTDAYSFAVISFIMIYKMHPYGSTQWEKRGKLGTDERKKMYVFDPKYYFDTHHAAHVPERMLGTPKARTVEEKWGLTPQYIRNLFDRTFHLNATHSREESVVKARSSRPTMQEWKDGLNKWYQELSAQKR